MILPPFDVDATNVMGVVYASSIPCVIGFSSFLPLMPLLFFLLLKKIIKER
jgi:hypothetical protein